MKHVPAMNKVVFLDRDGVINETPAGHGYVETWRQFRFLDGALAMLRALVDKGYRLVVVTNQQGVGKGLVQVDALETIHRNLRTEALRQGAKIDGVFYCPHLAADNCPCRKPKPGLIHQALAHLDYPVCLSRSWMIGDSPRDIQAGAAAGLKTLLVGDQAKVAHPKPTATAANIIQVAALL